MSIPGIEDEYYRSLPLLNEQGYEIATDENGDEILDKNGEPVIANYSCMQIEPVDSVSHVTFEVRKGRQAC